MQETKSWLTEAAQQAAAENKPLIKLAATTEYMAEARATAQANAAKDGVNLYIPHVKPKLVDGSETYPSVLAELLCLDPEKVELSNDKIMRAVSDQIGLTAPISGNRMSKKFSVQALAHVRAILARHGYDGSRVGNGTDVKRAIKAGKHPHYRTAHCSPASLIECKADGFVRNGHKYLYKQRERAATGIPSRDFCIRVAGVDVPMIAVLTLLGLGMQEFSGMDDAAVEAAQDMAAKAARLPAAECDRMRKEMDRLRGDRKAKKSGTPEYNRLRHLDELLGAVESLDRRNNVQRVAKPVRTQQAERKSYRVPAEEMMRAAWREHSSIGKQTGVLRSFADFCKHLADDPAAMARARALMASGE